MSNVGGSRDQVNRLLALVPYLQRRGEVSVAEAAREFGVPVATMRRDVRVLPFCGLPGLGMGDLIELDFDALDGEKVIRLSNADFLTRPLRLDSTEAAALVVGLRALAEGATPQERDVVVRALAKIEAAVGEAGGLAAQVDLRPVESPEVTSLRERLATAAAQRRQVRLRHRSLLRDEVTERVVDPIAVSVSSGHAYLDAWCHRVSDRRLFRLDRVETAEVLETPVSEHAALAPLDLTKGIFRPSPDDLVAVVRLAPAARWVTEYYPVESVEPADPDQPGDGGGDLVVRLRVSDPQWLVRLLLQLGGDARLLEPADLVAEVRAAASRVLDRYPGDRRTVGGTGSTTPAHPVTT
jgi:proteasome accessory factor C